MNVYLIQYDIVWENRQQNHQVVREFVEEASPEPGSLLILPEMFATGFSMNLGNTAPSIHAPGQSEDEIFLKKLANDMKCDVLAGVTRRVDEKMGINEAVAYSAHGVELVRYAKQQPFTFSGEGEVHLAGNEAKCFEWGGFKVSPLICYDLRFPELFRNGLDLGAEVFVVIASWPARRHRHWELLLQARAIENQAFVIGVNRCGTDPHADYSGGSMVVGPMGQVLCHAGRGAGVTEFLLDREPLQQWREQFPAWKERKVKYR